MAQILYLSYDGLTDPLGQSQVLPYIEGLTKAGHKFHIVSFEKADKYAGLKSKIEKRCADSGITWLPLTYTKNPPILSTLYDVDKLYRNCCELVDAQKFELVHCRSYITALVGLRLKKQFKLPFLFDMRGFWADERVDGKIWNLKNPVYRKVFDFFKRQERNFLEKSEAVVSLTHTGKAEIERWFNEDKRFGGNPDYYNYDHTKAISDKITVIPCATDLQHFDFQNITENKKKWLCAVHGLDPNLQYLGYVGSLGTWYLPQEMLQLYKVLLVTQPDLRFLVLSHDEIESFRSYAEKLNIPRSYIIHITAERREVPTLISLMTASVFFILPAYSKKASSPTKQGELMAMGIPVICNDHVGDTGDIIRKYKSGHVVSALETPDYEAVAASWKEIISIDPLHIRQGAEAYFSLNKGVAAYAGIYNSILNPVHEPV